MYYTDLVIDNETGARSPDAYVFQIGWAAFNRYAPEHGHTSGHVYMWMPENFNVRIDDDTMAFWLGQVQKMGYAFSTIAPDDLVSFLAEKHHSHVWTPRNGMEYLVNILQSFKDVEYVWTNGSSFDMAQVLYYFYNMGYTDKEIGELIHYRKRACLGTLRRYTGLMAPSPESLAALGITGQLTPHFAEHDCLVHAANLQYIIRAGGIAGAISKTLHV